MNPITALWRLVRFRLALYLAEYLLYVGYTLSLAFSGLILRAFFDRLAGEPGALPIVAIAGLQLGNSLLAMIGLGGVNLIPDQAFSRALIFHNVFARILARPGAQPLPANTTIGETLNTLRDDTQQLIWFHIELIDLFGFGLTAIVALVAMLRVSVAITLGVLAPLLAIMVITRRLQARVERYRVASRTSSSVVAGAIGDIFGAVQAIQVNNAEERVLAHFRKLNAARRQAVVRDRLLTQLINALADNMVVIGTALLLLFSARAIQTGRFTVGDFALFVAYIWPITILWQNIANQMTLYRQSKVSIGRLQTLMQDAPPQALLAPAPIHLRGPLPTIPAVVRTPADQLAQLEIRGLTYHYPGSDRGVTDVSFRVQPGTLTVVTGPIGAGKTTLLRTLLGLLPKNAGDILWNGAIVDDPAGFFVPPRVAYTPQTPRLFSETLRDNILIGLPDEPAQVQNALEQAVFLPDLSTMSDGLETFVGPRGMRLSGGQVQRAAAARMFVRQPELLVFDDLSSALDGETERLLWERLFAGERKPTCLVVSHRTAVLERADQVVVLNHGRIAH
ncbi:MAG TPA: ABC transporter ATP-binding protein [Caldilineaceae bacterium]|nr:ABC transporter ATP-binding protein [Caldilineaceae bacterium]